MHKYIDSKLTNDQRIYITYIKYLLKSQKCEEYWKFKLIVYEHALYKTKSKFLLMPLV